MGLSGTLRCGMGHSPSVWNGMEWVMTRHAELIIVTGTGQT
jgi:hypothetical protein